MIQKSATNKQTRAADATLDELNPTIPDGGLVNLTVNSRANHLERALVQFDLSALPNVGVKSAMMTLTVTTALPARVARSYGAYPVTSFFSEPTVTWNDRLTNINPTSFTAWTSGGGGDFSGTPTATANATSTTTTLLFDITSDVQTWYNGEPNYGELIADTDEGGGTNSTISFGSKEASISANAPSLSITYMQSVQNLTATAASNAVTLDWKIPAPIAGATVINPYTGVVILRRANSPVDKNSFPTDGTDPTLCSNPPNNGGTGIVIFDDHTGKTSFTDNAANDTCGAPVNGTLYFYKVFLRDSANNYSTDGVNQSTYVAEVSVVPNTGATGAHTFVSSWICATNALGNSVGAPSLVPGSQVIFGSGYSVLFEINAITGLRDYPTIALSSTVGSRSSMINSGFSSLAQDVIYVADADGLVYAIATDTGAVLWVVNPNALTTNNFIGGAAVQLKSASSGSFTLTHDLVVIGTNNAATTSTNQIVAVDGNTGAKVWDTEGNTGGIAKMDIVLSTPLIDYGNNAIWVTSRSNGGTGQPSLWKLNPNSGAVLSTAALGPIDSSPSEPVNNDVIFVGNNAGTLYAINPTTGAAFNASSNFASGDGPIVGYPVIINNPTNSNLYVVVFSGATQVHAVNYNRTTDLFTAAWTNPVTILVPSAPVAYSYDANVYVGSNDGKIHEIKVATGVDNPQPLAVNLDNGLNGLPAFIGNPSLDVVMSRLYFSTNDQRAYAFTYPF
ncbi:MAG: DNRLRE domain-containing protein [Candidatus Acidiferrales bacterium]